MILANCSKAEKCYSAGTNEECYAGVEINDPNACWEKTNKFSNRSVDFFEQNNP